MLLEVKDLTYSYRNIKVLDKVSFAVEDSELLCILGPNGAGKSTMFKCILQLLKDYKGEILLDNKKLKEYKIRELARKVAYIPQSHNPVFSYSVTEMVLMGTTSQNSPLSKPSKSQINIVEESLEKIGISYLKDRSFVNLSGGERQLVLIARALAQNAKILIMDEPTSDLDYGNQIRVLNIVKELTREGYTIIQSTHNPDQAFLYADKVLALYNHKVLSFGTPKYIINSGLIKKLYNVDVELNSLYDDKIRICIPKSAII
ncbi:ABC transporter ATP-binding protein [Terrisporobacter glycolicus]|uniref:Fe(3+) dicitrate transport ATP-binding protein FecE n=1 Tax=Terrisporobacter glycolicus ATCC 14880 = DSM 1288 TaxID=1121315 RepID=A0ABZ2EVV7_9FIRM|nr:ABC transporter ATP-binding protein [Terrisporobacter glycolicus]